MIEYLGVGKTANSSITGSLHLLKWQAYTALFVIIFTGCATFILLKFISIFVPLRMSEADMEEGDIAVHGHEVYPSDIPSLGVAGGTPGRIRHRTQARRALRRGAGRLRARRPWPRSSSPTTAPPPTRTRSPSAASGQGGRVTHARLCPSPEGVGGPA